MKSYILVILSVICAVHCNEFTVLSSPKSIEFKGSSEVQSSSLSEILAATLGYSVKGSGWTGLYMNDPFNTAKAVITVVVEGTESLDFKNSKSFNLVGDDTNFEGEFTRKVMDHSHLAVDVDLIGQLNKVETALGTINAGKLNIDVQQMKPKSSKNDADVLNQISFVDGLIDTMNKREDKPTALIVRLSLRMLSSKSPSYSEASKLITSTIEKLNIEMQKLYKNEAVVTVVTVAAHHLSRSKRQTSSKQEEELNKNNPHNFAELTDKDYPVVFNIIFWFTIVLIFSLIAISLALSNVEDKDSIIYRMTGARGKKDN